MISTVRKTILDDSISGNKIHGGTIDGLKQLQVGLVQLPAINGTDPDLSNTTGARIDGSKVYFGEGSKIGSVSSKAVSTKNMSVGTGFKIVDMPDNTTEFQLQHKNQTSIRLCGKSGQYSLIKYGLSVGPSVPQYSSIVKLFVRSGIKCDSITSTTSVLCHSLGTFFDLVFESSPGSYMSTAFYYNEFINTSVDYDVLLNGYQDRMSTPNANIVYGSGKNASNQLSLTPVDSSVTTSLSLIDSNVIISSYNASTLFNYDDGVAGHAPFGPILAQEEIYDRLACSLSGQNYGETNVDVITVRNDMFVFVRLPNISWSGSSNVMFGLACQEIGGWPAYMVHPDGMYAKIAMFTGSTAMRPAIIKMPTSSSGTLDIMPMLQGVYALAENGFTVNYGIYEAHFCCTIN